MLKLKCFDGIVPVSEEIGKQSNVIKDMLEITSGLELCLVPSLKFVSAMNCAWQCAMNGSVHFEIISRQVLSDKSQNTLLHEQSLIKILKGFSMFPYTGSPDDTNDNEIPVADSIHSKQLTVVVQLMTSKSTDKQKKILDKMSLVEVLEICVIVNYFDIPPILDLLCKVIAERVNLRTSSMINEMFTGVAKFSDQQFLRYSEAYSGKDINLIDYPICYNFECEEDEEEIKTGEIPLNKCTRCCLMKYCSRRCQKKDFPEHKKICAKIGTLRKKLDELANRLKNHHEDFRPPINYFEQFMGHFWGLADNPRAYCRGLKGLAEEISDLAHDRETEELYSAVLEIYVELLQLTTSDNQGIRFQLPFVLLNLNLDEDAYRFIKFWEVVVPSADDSNDLNWDGKWESLPSGTIYEDLFEVLKYENIRASDINLVFLTILTLIKLRIVAKHNQKKIQYTTLKENMQKLSCNNSGLLDILPVLKEHIVGDKSWIELMQKQEEHLDNYLQLILKRNKTLLPAVVNPEPLLNQPYPEMFSHGSPEEAYVCLTLCCRMIHRIPGAILKIKSLVGDNPEYDAVLRY